MTTDHTDHTVRVGTADDLDVVVVLELEVFASAAWSPRLVEEELAGLGDTRQLWIAEVPGEGGRPRPVGYAVGRYVGGVADLQRVAVLPSRRRGGIGGVLVDAVIAGADDRSCRRVLLDVAADNEAAVGLYEERGFRPIDRRPHYYPGDVDAVVMELALVPERTDG